MGGRSARPSARVADDSRPAEALGLVLEPRRALVQVEARPRSRAGPPLRGRPRALPPAGAEPLGCVLAARRGGAPAIRRGPFLAPPPRARAPRGPGRLTPRRHARSDGGAVGGRRPPRDA